MRELETDEICCVDGGLRTFVRIMGQLMVKHITTGDNSGSAFEQGDPSIVANVYGA